MGAVIPTNDALLSVLPNRMYLDADVRHAERKNALRSYDVFVGLCLTAFMFQFGKFGFLPLTVPVLLGLVAIAVQPGKIVNGLLQCARQRFMAMFLLFSLVTNVTANTQFGLRFGVVAGVGRWLSMAALLVVFIQYCSSRNDRPYRFLYLVTVLLIVAQGWYIAELIFPNVFVPIRTSLYYDWYLLEAYETNVSVNSLGLSIRTGLAPLLHLLGYFSAAGLALSLSNIYAMSWFTRVRQQGLAYVLLAVSVIAIALNLQRSALASGFSCLLLLCFSPFRARLMSRMPLAAAVVALVAVIGVPFVISNETRSRPSSSQEFTHIGEKLNRAGDVWLRLRMQVEAVRLIARAPFGLKASGISWADEGRAAAETASNVAGGDISVHNGYLSLMLNHGWFAVIVITTFLASLGSCIWKCVRHPGNFPGFRPEETVAIAIACFSLIFVIPSLHHASVFRREPVSLVFIALMSYCELTRRSLGRDAGNNMAIRGRTENNSGRVTGAA